jgi:glycosyltransferase involved in cell wall biosynthesis
MSSINSGLKLFVKRIDASISPHQPNHYIFQSEGMRHTATHGRGIPASRTSVIHSGIDTDKYAPSKINDLYAHHTFDISSDQNIVFFSGHMEERKGVAVIIKTAKYLINELKRKDIHFLILGNKNGQEKKYVAMYEGTDAENHITFGGYRMDVPKLLKSCSIGMIASTGWDSFPMSSIEMAATELPLVVSDIEGLREAISGETGFLYPPGDFKAAAEKLINLADDNNLRTKMGIKGRERAIKHFSVKNQINGIETLVRRISIPTP